MRTVYEDIEAFSKLAEELKHVSAQLIAGRPALRAGEKVAAGSRLCFEDLVFLREGTVEQRVGGQVLCFYEEGDFLIDCGGQSDLAYYTDFAVVVDVFARDSFLEAIRADSTLFGLWEKFHRLRGQLMTRYAAALQQAETDFSPEFRMFQPGETIIEQGAVDREVFTMTEGRAEVYVDEVKVGEVLPDEIFGAIAALSETPRTARVVAVESSMVLALPGEKFSELMKARPGTVHKLIGDMARTIVDLNKQVVARNGG